MMISRIMSILKILTDLWVIRQNIRHGKCNINLKLIKKIPVIFHNLRGCGSCLIMQEVWCEKKNVIPNGLEKYMSSTVNRNFVFIECFIDSMQFLNSSLDVLVKNLPDNDFKNLSKEFN